MQNNNTPKRRKNQATPIYRADGKIIGNVVGDTYRKEIHDAHILQRPRAIASDVDALRQAAQAGAIYFAAHHVESGRDYIAPIERFYKRGFDVGARAGAARQIGLLLSDFNCDDNTPTPTTPKPVQDSLFNLNIFRR